jgi:hypothetical protein
MVKLLFLKYQRFNIGQKTNVNDAKRNCAAASGALDVRVSREHVGAGV